MEAPSVPSARIHGREDPDTDRALDAVLKETFPAVGDEFLHRLVACLASALRVRHALLVASAPAPAAPGPRDAGVPARPGTLITACAWCEALGSGVS